MWIWQFGSQVKSEIKVVGHNIFTDFNVHVSSLLEERAHKDGVKGRFKFKSNILDETGSSESHATLHDPQQILIVHLCHGQSVSLTLEREVKLMENRCPTIYHEYTYVMFFPSDYLRSINHIEMCNVTLRKFTRAKL